MRCHPISGRHRQQTFAVDGVAFLQEMAVVDQRAWQSGRVQHHPARQQRWRCEEVISMSVQANKALNQRFYDEVWNAGKLDVIKELVSSDYVCHNHFMPETIHGPEGFEEYIALFRLAFPDVHLTLEAVFGEEDLIATRWRARGTFSGPLPGLAPTGRAGEVSGITITRYAGGKCVESWVERDDLGMLKAMGVAPELAAV
jgi:predicted ester cyclase